jgi:hypothetical protein
MQKKLRDRYRAGSPAEDINRSSTVILTWMHVGQIVLLMLDSRVHTIQQNIGSNVPPTLFQIWYQT